MTRSPKLTRFAPVLAAGLALAVLAGAVAAGFERLRRVVRQQMVDRDGEILYAVAQARQFSDNGADLERRLREPAEQLALVLDVSQIREGVMGVRLFDAQGRFVTAFPPNVKASSLDPAALSGLEALHPASRFSESGRLSDVLMTSPALVELDTNRVSLLEVAIPIHARGQSKLLGCAQLVLDARDLDAQRRALDRHLARQALAVFLPGAALLSGAFAWGFRRLRRANNLLQARTAGLLHANHELTLAAKTSALGAVTAHLIHGLSNPLANLQDFVAARGASGASEDDWRDAVAATTRMRELVREVVRVVGEESEGGLYEMSLAELGSALAGKARPLARELGVELQVDVASRRLLSNHPANIILLILDNLVHNSLQVLPRGGTARVSIYDRDGGVVCEVADQGPGFPEHLRKAPFAPCRSTKGGAGIGLAISAQLAAHLGAQLELKETGSKGAVIWLRLPHELFQAPAAGPAGDGKGTPGRAAAPVS